MDATSRPEVSALSQLKCQKIYITWAQYQIEIIVSVGEGGTENVPRHREWAEETRGLLEDVQ